jgi:hypothetical protein
MYRRASVVSATVASRPNWDPFLVTDMVERSRDTGVTEELRALLTIEFEALLQMREENLTTDGTDSTDEKG